VKQFISPGKNKNSRRNDAILRGKTKFSGEAIHFTGKKQNLPEKRFNSPEKRSGSPEKRSNSPGKKLFPGEII